MIRTWDSWLVQATGRSAGEVCGRRVTDLFPEIERRGHLAAFERALLQGSVELLVPKLHGFLIQCPAKEGARYPHMQQRTVIAALRESPPVGEAAGPVTGLMITIEDVTARLESEAAPLAAGIETWQSRRAAIQEIAASHEATPVRDLIQRLKTEHRDPNLLNTVLPLLASGAWESLEPLAELARDEDGEVRMYAALALGDLRDRRAVPALRRLLHDADANVRYHAIEALSKLRATDAAGDLADLAEGPDLFSAFAAVDALAAIGEPGVAFRLVPLLRNETLRTAAIRALAQLGDHRVVQPLAAMLDQPRLTAVVAEALVTLEDRYQRQYGEGDAIRDLVGSRTSPLGAQNLLKLLDNATGETLRPVVRVLGWVGTEPVIGELTRLLGSPSLRTEVIEVLVRQGSVVVDPLCRQLGSDEVEVRLAAILALGRIGDARSVRPLIEALEDPELTVEAAGALARIGDARAYDSLLPLLGHRRAAVRQAAIGALNSLGQARMEQDMKRLLDDPNPHVRESAARIAGYFGYAACASRLLERLNDEDESVRRAAIETLPYLQDTEAAPLLDAALSDRSPKIRAAAAQSLGNLDDEVSLPGLTRALRDSDSWVRYYAARSLGQLRNAGMLDPLCAVLSTDPAPQVRIAAAEALGRIGGERAIEALSPLAASDDRDLARAALLALGAIRHADAMRVVRGVLRAGDAALRLEAVHAIALGRNREAAEILEWTAAADGSEPVGEAAVEELARMAIPEAIDALLRLVVDRRLREKAVAEIARLGPAHLDRIAKGLSSVQLETRRAIVDALSRMKHPAASEALAEALSDERAEVRLAALAALRRLGSLALERRLHSLAHEDPDPGVRRAAAQALEN